MSELRVDYTTFIGLVRAKNLPIQFIQDSDAYQLYFADGPFGWVAYLPKDGGANQTDFETNWLPTANKPIVQVVAQESAPTSAIISTVIVNPTDTVIVGINLARKGLILYNPNDICYISLGVGASSNSFSYRLTPNTGCEIENWSGSLHGCKATTSSNVLVTEKF